MNVYFVGSQMIPYLGFFSMLCLMLMKQHKVASQSFLIASGLGFVTSLIGLSLDSIGLDKLNFLLSSLILFVSLNIQQYSKQYFDGDLNARSYFIKLGILTISANSMVLINDNVFFSIFWIINNLSLVSLMIHQPEWKAQKNAGLLSLITLGMGSIALISGFYMINHLPQPYHLIAKILLIGAGMCQSAIWPFHRWLLSSLNSPTPVSALMHAGIVNGGGILLIKYHTLFCQDINLMHFIFVMGIITAVLGGFWKLIQTDIKKMLANSTMAQMGFMFMQCGLGLFPAAIAHIICHGLFKAYLFLNSGSSVKSKFNCPKVYFKPIRYVWIALATFIAIISFSYTAQINLTYFNTYWFMIGIVAISAWQLSDGLVGKNHALLDITLVGIFSGVYGLTLRLMESFFTNGHQLALPLDPLFLVGFGMLLLIWVLLNTAFFAIIKKTRFWAWLYMTSLNHSQSKSNCISSIRNDIKV